MKKFILTLFVCLMLATTSTNAAILKDDEGFSYIDNYNYLVFSAGSQVCSAYDLTSIHIVADNNSRFEFNVIALTFRNKDLSISQRNITNFREDYGTGKIFVNGNLMRDYMQWGKTSREIYYKMKSAALSR